MSYAWNETVAGNISFTAGGTIGLTSTDATTLTASRLRAVTNTIRTGGSATTFTTGSQTLSASVLETRLVVGAPAGAVTYSVPDATTVIPGLSLSTNDWFDFSVINTGAGSIAIGVGIGGTVSGVGTIASGTSGMFRFFATGVNSYTVYRLA